MSLLFTAYAMCPYYFVLYRTSPYYILLYMQSVLIITALYATSDSSRPECGPAAGEPRVLRGARHGQCQAGPDLLTQKFI